MTNFTSYRQWAVLQQNAKLALAGSGEKEVTKKVITPILSTHYT
jgi:hypothetical protein